MNRKGGYRRHKYHFLGLVLLGSLFFSFLIFLLACEREYKSEAIYYFLLALPAYIVVIYCAISCLLPVKDKNYLLYSLQSTVEGLFDQNTSELIDKDNDGKILISEYYPLTEEEVLKKILAVDSNFSKTDFYAWVKHLYSIILDSLDKKNYNMLRRFESDYLYNRHVSLFEDIKASGAKISNYAVKGVLLKDFKIEGDKDILIVALSASINKENIYDDSYQSYILTFARKHGVKTIGTLLEKETNCPNCGAVLDLNSEGVCSYCHTLISNGDFGWILIDMKSIKLVDY